MELGCSATHLGSVGPKYYERGITMDYKAKIMELVTLIENEKLLRFIYYMLDDAINRYDTSFNERFGK